MAKPQIAYIRFVDESGNEIPMSEAEKDEKKKKWSLWLVPLGLTIIGLIISLGSGGTGGFRIKSIQIINLAPNQRQNG